MGPCVCCSASNLPPAPSPSLPLPSWGLGNPALQSIVYPATTAFWFLSVCQVICLAWEENGHHVDEAKIMDEWPQSSQAGRQGVCPTLAQASPTPSSWEGRLLLLLAEVSTINSQLNPAQAWAKGGKGAGCQEIRVSSHL